MASGIGIVRILISSVVLSYIFCWIFFDGFVVTHAVSLKIGDSMNERLLKFKGKRVNVIFPQEDDSTFLKDLDGNEVQYDDGIVAKASKRDSHSKGKRHKKRTKKKRHSHHHHGLEEENKALDGMRFKNTVIDSYKSLLADIPTVNESELEPLPEPTTTTTRRSTTAKTIKPTTTTRTTRKTKPPTTTSAPTPTLSSTLPPKFYGVKDCSISKTPGCGLRKRITAGGMKIPEVHTKRGKFRGRIVRVNNSEIYAFLGIPFASPPVKNLRFKIPFPLEPTSPESIINASKFKSRCFPTKLDRNSALALYKGNHSENLADSFDASEDCLYLNVWIPKPETLKTLAPTIVWIHGETFLNGANVEDYNTIAGFVAMTKIIVVSVQFRLGALGFLFDGTSDAPGNVGVLDQIKALEWLDENLVAFGGNPNAITLMGHDIGAAFVGFHLISKTSPSFFKQAILIGGAPTQPHVFRMNQEVFNATLQFSSELGCNQVRRKERLACLRNIDPMTIWKVQSLFYSNAYNALSFPFVMTNDGLVLEDTPTKLLAKGKGKTGKVLIGVAGNPGSTVLMKSVEGILSDKPTFVSYDKFTRVMEHLFGRFSKMERDFIMHQYKSWHNLEDGYANELRLSDAIADFYFTCPQRRFADLWSSRGLGTNFFVFSQKSTALRRPEWMGAVHGDELDFLFGVPIRFPHKYSKTEVYLSGVMVKILQDFVQSGTIVNGWERYGKATPSYVDLNANFPLSNRFGPRGEQCDFWNELLPELQAIME